MDTIGIDLAAQDEKTAICKIRWSRGRAVVAEPLTGASTDDSDTQLASLIGSDQWVGVDAPFGWPADFVRAVSGYARRAPWPELDPDRLRYRLTDRLVRDEIGLSPLSVSSDRIGVTAWRCARLLSRARAGRAALDRSGRDKVVEVYPAAALKQWGFDTRGYKHSGGAERQKAQRAARDRLLKKIEASCSWLRWEDGAREACVASDDALDSFLCALVARAAASRETRWPETTPETTAAAAEGWIHIPIEGSLERLEPHS
jgi:predicted nuclease with RNAse H fold